MKYKINSKLSQDLETRLSAAERLCNFFNKNNKEKTDQFKPIIKQTDIKDKLTLDIDGSPYQIDGKFTMVLVLNMKNNYLMI